MAMIRRDDDADVLEHAFETTGGIERLLQHPVDALDDRQRRDGADLVAAIVVVGEVRDRQIWQRRGCKQIPQHRTSAGIVHSESMEESALSMARSTIAVRPDEIAEP